MDFTTTAPDLTPPIGVDMEEEFHSSLDYLQTSNRRKTALLAVSWVIILLLIGVDVYLALQGKPVYVVAVAPNGEEYVISWPKKTLDLRDAIVYDTVRRDLTAFSEAYFERSSVTAQHDYEKARWFLLPGALMSGYDLNAMGKEGWVGGLLNHTLPESHVTINTVEMRQADLQKEPYQARVYMTRTGPAGQRQDTIGTLTFVVEPCLTKGWARVPLYNPLGVFIVKPTEETPDFRSQVR